MCLEVISDFPAADKSFLCMQAMWKYLLIPIKNKLLSIKVQIFMISESRLAPTDSSLKLHAM